MSKDSTNGHTPTQEEIDAMRAVADQQLAQHITDGMPERKEPWSDAAGDNQPGATFFQTDATAPDNSLETPPTNTVGEDVPNTGI